MTVDNLKDKLNKEAEEFINNRFKHEILGKRVQSFFTYWELLCSAVDFAEPRENRIAELEKENTELKKQHKDVCENLANTHRNIRGQLTKAKELLNDWLKIAHKNNARCYGFVKDTEQFLKENE